MKLKILLLILLAGFLFSGCSKEPECEQPYILSGDDCCLDENNNQICDGEETTTTQRIDLKVCLDTDKGQNYNQRGIVFYTTQEGEKGNFLDYCWKDGRVVEYWCTPIKTPQEAIIACPPGYECLEGACMSVTTSLSSFSTISTTTTITLPEIPTELAYTPENPPAGAKLVEVDSGSYGAEFKNYRFAIDHFSYSSEYKVSRILLNIQNPDGTLVQSELGWDPCENEFYDAREDDIVMRLWEVEEYVGKLKAQVYLWSYQEHPVMKEKPARELPHPQAQLLSGITSEGYSAEYKNYLFKIDKLIYPENYQIDGVILDVKKPDGRVEQVELKRGKEEEAGELKIFAYLCGEFEESRAIASGDIYVWEE